VYTIDGFFLPTMDAFATRILRKSGYANIIKQLPATPMLHFAPVERYQPIMLWDIFLPDSWERNFSNGKFFENKIVVIGPYGTWSKDMHMTSVSNSTPMEGPKVHLNAIAAALQGDFIDVAGSTVCWSWLLASLLLPIFLFGCLQNRIWCYLIWIVGNLLILSISYLVYLHYSYITPLVFPLLGWNLTWIILICAETIWSWMEKKRIRSTLNRYLSKEVAATLIAGKDNYYQVLGGIKREAAVLFSDLRGFTPLSESLDPVQLVSLLNEYLTEMVEEIFLHRGRLDKFMGDAVMAVWGDLHQTESVSKSCIQAIDTSLGMIHRLHRMNLLWVAAGKPTLSMGIGIHCGDLIFGNLGSEHRMELTVIGDTVNLASRLEGQTKVYQQPLLVSAQVKQHTEHHYCWRSVDIVRVKGRSQSLEIFTLDPVHPLQKPAWLDRYHMAVQMYRGGVPGFGLDIWTALAAELPEDFLIQRYKLSAEVLSQGEAIEKLGGQNPLWFGDTVRPEK
jgi:adenylate cyclase